jgi:hypothetical protein
LHLRNSRIAVVLWSQSGHVGTQGLLHRIITEQSGCAHKGRRKWRPANAVQTSVTTTDRTNLSSPEGTSRPGSTWSAFAAAADSPELSAGRHEMTKPLAPALTGNTREFRRWLGRPQQDQTLDLEAAAGRGLSRCKRPVGHASSPGAQ